MMHVEVDTKALGIVENFQRAKSYFDVFLEKASYRLGSEGVSFIRESGALKASASFFGVVKGTGALESSLDFEVINTGDGYQVNFTSLFYGQYIDQGNGTAMIRPKSSNFLAAGKRVGNLHPLRAVHPMGQGSYSSWKPKEFTKDAMRELERNGPAMLDREMQELLDWMVEP